MTEPRYEDPLGRTFFPRRDKDGIILEVAPGQLVCDFCLAPGPTWLYPCKEVEIVGHATFNASDDEWAACDTCHRLIERRDLKALMTHMVDRQKQQQLGPDWTHPARLVALQYARTNLLAFMRARSGPAQRCDPATGATL